MRKENMVISERQLMFCIGGQLFAQAPNKEPRKAEIIMKKVRDAFREKAYNDDEYYVLSIEKGKGKLHDFIKDLLFSIPEFKELNFSQNRYDKGISADSKSKSVFVSRYDKVNSEIWKSDIIDLDAFVDNVEGNIYNYADCMVDCMGCIYENKKNNCKTCFLNPDLSNNRKSSRKPKRDKTFACKFNCYRQYYICCEECNKKDKCDRKCDSNSKTCGQAINRMKDGE